MSRVDPVPSDAAARDRAVMHPGSVLVQAPAGSGKTTLLVRRFLRVLATVDAPDGVLALTFTRRAAHEMRERIGAALAAAAGDAPMSDPQTVHLARAAVRRFRELGIDLAAQASRLRIETIDAFNGWLAGGLPVGSGLGTIPRIAEDASEAYREAARRTLAYAEDDGFGAAVERVLALFDLRHEWLVDLLVRMLPARQGWLAQLAGGLRASVRDEEAELPRVRRRLEEDLAVQVRRTLANAVDALGGERLAAVVGPLRAAARRGTGAVAALAVWTDRETPLRADPEDLAHWRGLAAVALTRKGGLRSRLTVNEGFAADAPEKPVMRDWLLEADRDPRAARALADVAALPDPRFAPADWARIRDVARVLVLAAAILEDVFRERGAIDFPAVSIAALRALGEPQAPTDLALRLDYRLRHVLIDEFQDTSGAQLDLLSRLTEGWQADDGRSVFCVGDPMQAIYGFRQAEVRAFLEIADCGLGGVPFSVERLTDNFRAAPGLVDWVNATFARILPAQDDRDRGAIAFRPARAARAADATDAPAFAAALFESREREADAVADWIAARHARHPAQRIAVLVRARAHALEIAGALRARGVEVRAPDLAPLAERAAARDLILLARALRHRGDRVAWLGVLRAPWAGLALADLLALARGAATLCDALGDAATRATLSTEGRIRCERLHAVFAAAFAARDRSGFARWVECVWLALGGPASLASADDRDDSAAALARLRELEREGLPDPAEFDARFATRSSTGGGEGAVELMTIHKAKGLEFDAVVVPGLDRTISARNDELLLTLPFSREGRDGLLIAARPPIGANADPLFEFLRRAARDGARLEAERLLYVACTRAKRELRLTGVGDPASAPRAGSLLATLWPAAGRDFRSAASAADLDVGIGDRDAVAPAAAACATAAPGAAAVTAAVPATRARLARIPAGWHPPPLVAAAALPLAPSALAPRPEAPPFDWVGETARQVGILVHAELQRLEPGTMPVGGFGAREPQLRRWLAARGVPRDWLSEASRRAVAALDAVCEDPRARWILAGGRREALREGALSGVVDGEIVHVVLDRSFVDEAGVRWVIDYKTGEHRGGDPESFLDREVERYRAQMARYATLARRLGPEPVRLALYFPLMRAWREWSAG